MSDALISPCGTYRYTLGREIAGGNTHKPCLFVMLNPSTADAQRNDPTIRRCIGFAKREGCTFLTVVNLFAYRTTYPTDLAAAFANGVDVFGPENDQHVDRELRRHTPLGGGIIIAAWGADPMATIAADTRRKLAAAGALCLGTTKSGEPRHPVRLPGNAPLIKWES